MIWQRNRVTWFDTLRRFIGRDGAWALTLVVCCSLLGCATPTPNPARTQPFSFEQDTFAFANELAWEYQFDPETGEVSHSPRVPSPEYYHHCFVVARSARQFFAHARFDPMLPRVDPEIYRELIHRVVSISPRRSLPVSRKIVIPGYADLREFSTDYESLLKEECGGAWQSYFQRGHWRMLLPFTTSHQARIARQMLESVKSPQPLVVHAVRFPSLAINHALVVYRAEETVPTIEFKVYDPNNPGKPVSLTYDRTAQQFSLAPNTYFKGGRANIYQVFHSWNY